MFNGSYLKKVRTDLGLTQKKLSEESGVHVRTLARLEKGGGNPKINTLSPIASSLNMTVDELFLRSQS